MANAFEPALGRFDTCCVLGLSQHTDPAAKFCVVRNRDGVVEERQSIPVRRYEPAIFKQGLDTFGLARALLQCGGSSLPCRLQARFAFF